MLHLTKLTELDLSDNSITGTIPPELVGLAKLTYLALDGSMLTGLVPELQFEQYTRGNSNHWPLTTDYCISCQGCCLETEG